MVKKVQQVITCAQQIAVQTYNEHMSWDISGSRQGGSRMSDYKAPICKAHGQQEVEIR